MNSSRALRVVIVAGVLAANAACSSGEGESDAITATSVPALPSGPPVTGGVSDIDPDTAEKMCDIADEVLAIVATYTPADAERLIELTDQLLDFRAPGVHQHLEKIRMVMSEEDMDTDLILERFETDPEFKLALEFLYSTVNQKCV